MKLKEFEMALFLAGWQKGNQSRYGYINRYGKTSEYFIEDAKGRYRLTRNNRENDLMLYEINSASGLFNKNRVLFQTREFHTMLDRICSL
jgi:hypothetical protein